MSLGEVVASLERIQEEQVRAARAEAERGDALYLVLTQVLGWLQADAMAHPEVKGYQKRVEVLTDQVEHWKRLPRHLEAVATEVEQLEEVRRGRT